MPERVIEAAEAAVRYREEPLPTHHESHATPDTMVRRQIQFEPRQGQARNMPSTAIAAASTPGRRGESTRGCKQTLKS